MTANRPDSPSSPATPSAGEADRRAAAPPRRHPGPPCLLCQRAPRRGPGRGERQLGRYAEPIRRRLGADLLGVGLWLASPVVSELVTDPAAVGRLRRQLHASGLEVVSLNAFPCRGFHDPVVKKAVYRPDWRDPRRLAYTLDCALILAGLRSTRDELRAALAVLFGAPAARCEHVEVETYTWPVLPSAPDDTDLIDGMAAELAWLAAELESLGLRRERR